MKRTDHLNPLAPRRRVTHYAGLHPVSAIAAVVVVAALASSAVGEDFVIEDGDVDAFIAAVNAANSNDESDTIHLAENGHYLLEVAYDSGVGLPTIQSEITIEGNGSTIERSSEDGTRNFRFFYLPGSTDADLTLVNLTLHNGQSSHGGAIRNWGNSVTLIGCTLSNNSTTGSSLGGAIHSDNGGHITITGSTLIGNTAHRGGAINKHGTGGNVIITDSVIADNVATGGSTSGGGGLYLAGSGSFNISGTTISGNATISPGQGGGIRLASNHLTLTDCTISDNSSGNDGGGVYLQGSGSFNGTTISGNTAENNAGGLWAQGTTNATNCTFSGNTAAERGGGIYVQATVNVTNCTVADNTAGVNGGGIQGGQSLSMTNSIVAYNTGGADVHNGFNDLGYNIVEDGGGISEETSMSGDPMLGPLADNGGPTMTHALLPGSLALVNGDCAGGEVTIDQRGMPRPQCNACDIGAFEFAGLPSFGDLNCDGSIDGADLAVLLGAWGPCDSCKEPDDCPADLDGNCQVDGADLAILLGNWG